MSLDTSSAGDERVGDGGNAEPLAAALAAAEIALANRFGAAISLVEPEDLAGSGPAIVARVKVDSSPFSLPRTLVIKHYPGSQTQPPDPFATEAASYQLFTALSALPSEDRICPELIGHDGTHRILVLEDLGQAPTLEDKLSVADSRSAESALLSWARAMGKMHATTADREPDFHALLRRLGSGSQGSAQAGTLACRDLPGMLHQLLDVPTSEDVLKRVAAAIRRAEAAELRAFSPADLSPANNLVANNGVRFLDFERGCVRNALIDVAHVRVPSAYGPGARAFPPGMPEAMIAAWRAEVRQVWPVLADDDFLARGLLDGQLLCLWTQTRQSLGDVLADPDAGPTSTAAALLTGWRDLATHAAQLGLPDIAGHAETVAGALERRFGHDLRLAVYGAFQ